MIGTAKESKGHTKKVIREAQLRNYKVHTDLHRSYSNLFIDWRPQISK